MDPLKARTLPECLDLRHLPAPEPMARALGAVDDLEPGQSVTVLTPMMPLPLLHALELRGFVATAQLFRDGCARVVVTRPSE
jgi:uncharacterized protein (DUF2249 family)